MSMAAPTFSQVKAQVAAVRRKVEGARVIGINAAGRWTGDRIQREGDETFVIDQCDSPLAMRIALRDDHRDATKVLITSLDENELDDDILVRLARRRLFAIDSWQIVKSLFDARTIDPRVTKYGWIAEELLALSPTQGYAPAAGGFLDADRVWGVLLRERLGLSSGRPDLIAILRWSTDAGAVGRWRSAEERFRHAAVEWMRQTAGPAAEDVLACIKRLDSSYAVCIGLASGVVFSHEARGKIDKAIGKMEERYYGGETPTQAILNRWHEAAKELVRGQMLDAKEKRGLLIRADAILNEVGAEEFAYVCDTSPLGFDQRLARFGEQLSSALASSAIASHDSFQEIRRAITAHDRAQHEARRVERADMALRLLRWVSVDGPIAGEQQESLGAAASYHLAEGGFVDWARWALWAGDPVRELSEAYSKLFTKVTQHRQQHAQRFAELLRDWTAAGAKGAGVIPVEHILADAVAPLADLTPVLLVLIDGMSAAVWRELLSDLTRRDWTALVPKGAAQNPPVLASVPSVTQVSRTSLFCGELKRGSSGDEQKGFAAHPELVAQSRSGYPPVLFHKASLSEDEDVVLAEDIRREIESNRRRVVGVVVNAIDDHLAKGDQIDVQWTRDAIKVLPTLLHEASSSGRAVVLLSDHGHILDHGTKSRTYEHAGERWRPDVGKPCDDEIQVRGERVVAHEGDSLIAPWSEGVRYTAMKKNGYHGGLTPQEMVVSMTVLSSSASPLPGWVDAPVDYPSWWDEPGRASAGTDRREHEIVQSAAPGLLFPIEKEEKAEPEVKAAGQAGALPSWISALLESSLFTEQKTLGGRAVPSDEVLTQLLVALDARGGKMTVLALARVLGRSPHRLAGILAAAQRILNVDGYAVFTRDDSSDSIVFNRELLSKQFDLT